MALFQWPLDNGEQEEDVPSKKYRDKERRRWVELILGLNARVSYYEHY